MLGRDNATKEGGVRHWAACPSIKLEKNEYIRDRVSSNTGTTGRTLL
jgi:hypothetical protein